MLHFILITTALEQYVKLKSSGKVYGVVIDTELALTGNLFILCYF